MGLSITQRGRRLNMDYTRQSLINSTIRRIVELHETCYNLISDIDLGCSNKYDRDRTLQKIESLKSTMFPLNAEIEALKDFLAED